MNSKEIPLSLKGNSASIYGDFGYRFAALLLDIVITLPISLGVLYFNSKELNNFYITFPCSIIFALWYYIYLPKNFGATPGKRIVGLQLLKINGDDISYKDAFLRYLPYFINTIISVCCMVFCIQLADSNKFASLEWQEQSRYLTSFLPIGIIIQGIYSTVLVIADFTIYITSQRNQSLKDMVAGTVVVFRHMVPDIKAEMSAVTNTQNGITPVK
jgi:uncharacterized RDD family membrane protein YckC